jgi:pilus assembly protein Flp/PilA
MQLVKKQLKQLISDEQGGEIIEYVLIAGLIIVAAISVIGAFGTKVVAKWTSVNSSL